MGILSTEGFVEIANGAYLMVADCADMGNLVANVGTLSNYNGATSLINAIQNSLKPVGLALMTLFFLFSIFSDAMNETFSFERFVKSFTRYFFGFGLVQISGSLCDFGDGLSQDIATLISSESEKAPLENIYTKDNIGGFWHAIFITMILVLFGNIMGLIMKISMYFILFSRLIEMAVRAAFMPIAVGLVTDGGWSGSAGRYIKKYIALCLQGPAIVLLGTLGSKLMGGAANLKVDIGTSLATLGGIVPVIAVGMATIGLAKQSITVLNDVLGA